MTLRTALLLALLTPVVIVGCGEDEPTPEATGTKKPPKIKRKRAKTAAGDKKGDDDKPQRAQATKTGKTADTDKTDKTAKTDKAAQPSEEKAAPAGDAAKPEAAAPNAEEQPAGDDNAAAAAKATADTPAVAAAPAPRRAPAGQPEEAPVAPELGGPAGAEPAQYAPATQDAPPPAARPTAAPAAAAAPSIGAAAATGGASAAEPPPLDVTGYLSRTDLERVVPKALSKHKLRRAALPGVKPSPTYNALYYAPAKGDDFGVGVQVWRDRNLVDSRTRFNTMRATWTNVVKTNKITEQGFRSHFGDVVTLVFADSRRPLVAAVTCDVAVCKADELIELATRVKTRLR
jgi:hypothetical protein